MLTPEQVLILIIVLVAADFLLEQILDLLNLRYKKGKQVPEEFRDVYPQEKFKRSLNYQKDNLRLSVISSTFSVAILILVLALGWLGELDQWVAGFTEHRIWRALAFFGIIFLANDVLNIPFQLYDQFVIEEKYGFNKSSISVFISDKLKGYLLSIIIGGLMLAALIYLVMWLETDFWWVFWVVATAFVLFMNLFYTSLIVPLFNKLTPLEDQELREAIEKYCDSVDFPLQNVYVMDGSKRSTKANAYFTGLGKRKKIVLFDTLIEKHSKEELVAVLSHEVGHYKKKHIFQGFISSFIQIGLTLYILSLLVFAPELSKALGGSSWQIHINLVAFGILYSPISRLISLLSLWISRKNEYQADAYAAETYRGDKLIAALKKLSADSLSNLFPHPWYVVFHYSHPPLIRRIKAIGREKA